MEEQYKIPPGLYKCPVCGEYRGKCKKKYLNWSYYVDPDIGKREGEEYITFSCLCDGIPCPKCGKNKIHRPISNIYDPETNSAWHFPWFYGIGARCKECAKKEKEEKEGKVKQEEN